MNRLCIDCGAWLNSDDLDLNPAGLWCVKHELARQVEAEREFNTRPVHSTQPASQVRFGNEKGLPWVDTQPHDRSYLAKPIRWSQPDLVMARAVTAKRAPAK